MLSFACVKRFAKGYNCIDFLKLWGWILLCCVVNVVAYFYIHVLDNHTSAYLCSYFDFYQKVIIVPLFHTGTKMFRHLFLISGLKEKRVGCMAVSAFLKGNRVVILTRIGSCSWIRAWPLLYS